MSRVAKAPITLSDGVTVTVEGQQVTVKGPKGSLQHQLHTDVRIAVADGEIHCSPAREAKTAWAQAGTARALLNNMVVGTTAGFERKLKLVGVGYGASLSGKTLVLKLGFSHLVNYPIPDGIEIEVPGQTEVVIKGANKQRVGQVAAEIRAYRPPEPYKGKGVRYADEQVQLKEVKKK